ncbi:MAG: UDP-N-acetylmuramoyl-tripeptide--D-alanyl-D-alanine ligase [Eubacteriaceae bacterium]
MSKLLDVVQGKIIQEGKAKTISGVKIDSRKTTFGDLYIPILGEKNNGHDFIDKAFENGCEVTLSQEPQRKYPKGMTVIFVDSTLEAMKALASYHRHRYGLPVIGITGSSGKTTTKDLVASVLSQKYYTLKTQGNFNNEYGIPQTLFNLEPEHEIAVIEMGMDHLGEIARSIESVDPQIAVITNIGLTHIEILKTQDNIFKAKKEILERLNEEGVALVNGDDPFLRKLSENKQIFQTVTFGIHGSNDFIVKSFDSHSRGLNMIVQWEKKELEFSFSFPGEHNVYNCLVAIWLGLHFKMSQEEIQKGLDAFVPSGNRMDISEIGNVKIINDSYNANPDAMRSALNVLRTMKEEHKRAIAILGDMLEMGDFALTSHYEIGKYAAECCDVLIGVGEFGEEICRGFGDLPEKTYHVEKAEKAGELMASLCKPGDIILIKASRGVGLEKTIDYIKEEVNEWK